MSFVLFDILHGIQGFDPASGDLGELSFQEHSGQGLEVIHKEHPLNMIELMLDHSGSDPAELPGHLLELLVQVFDMDGPGPLHRLMDVGNAQATFSFLPCFFRTLSDPGINEDLLDSLISVKEPLAVLFAHMFVGLDAIHQEQTEWKIHLWGRQPAPIGRVQGIPHITNVFFQPLIILDILASLP